jgi:hypothetical protein
MDKTAMPDIVKTTVSGGLAPFNAELIQSAKAARNLALGTPISNKK